MGITGRTSGASFGLTATPTTPEPSRLVLPPQGNELDLVGVETPPGYEAHGFGASRINKRQIFCRKCHKEVERTEQTGLNSGRRVIVCRFQCHGDMGEIRICEDQLSSGMVFEVFEGEPSLRAPSTKLALTDNRGPQTIDIEAEVVPPDKPRLTE